MQVRSSSAAKPREWNQSAAYGRATYRSRSEAEAVASYRCARLPIRAKNPNAFTFGWFRRQQNFDGDCPLRQNGVFGELDESHALVAVASNDFHRLGVSDGHNNTRAGEANGCRHGEMSGDRTR